MTRATASPRPERGPWAAVLGDTDLLRPVALTGAPCAVVGDRTEPARRSRLAREVVDVAWNDGDRLVEALLTFADTHDQPVVFYEWDWHVEALAGAQSALEGRVRIVLPPQHLVGDLMDKRRFAALAARAGLPVPASAELPPGGDPATLGVPLPVVIKPLPHRTAAWRAVAGSAKVLGADSGDELTRLAARLAAAGAEGLVQERIPGDESRVESYHAYVDAAGAVAGEFTGRKLRTWPSENGFSTAITTTDAADVLRAGRDVVDRLRYRGVLKADFKRDPDGRLRLLEVNPRFNLWHHVGARAGVNIPALVYADLTGGPRPSNGPARPGVTWCVPWQDARSARRADVRAGAWARWALRCDTHAVMAWDDPMPFVGGKLAAAGRRAIVRLPRRRG